MHADANCAIRSSTLLSAVAGLALCGATSSPAPTARRPVTTTLPRTRTCSTTFTGSSTRSRSTSSRVMGRRWMRARFSGVLLFMLCLFLAEHAFPVYTLFPFLSIHFSISRALPGHDAWESPQNCKTLAFRAVFAQHCSCWGTHRPRTWPLRGGLYIGHLMIEGGLHFVRLFFVQRNCEESLG